MAELKRLYLYVNAETGRFVNSVGSEIDNASKPQFFLNEHIILCMTLLDSTGAPCPLAPEDTFELAVDTDFDSSTSLMAFSGNTAVDVPGDWTGISRAGGKISVQLHCNTAAFDSKLGAAPTLEVKIELKKYNSGNPSILLQDRATARNLVNDGAPTPEPSDPTYYTSSQVDSLLREGRELQFSVDGSTLWHDVQATADLYWRERYPGGEWGVAVKMAPGPKGDTGLQGPKGDTGATGADGATGANGTPGANAPAMQIQFSVDGSTNWHTTFATGDKYQRVSTDGGSTWSSAMKFVGDNGAGDVVGPSSAANNNFAAYDGTTGKLVKDSGLKASDFAASSHNHDSSYASATHNHDSAYSAASHNHDSAYEAKDSNIQTHISSTSNPHSVTKAQVGLGNVANVDTSNAANITTGTLPAAQLPAATSSAKGAIQLSGTASNVLHGDGSWSDVSGGSGSTSDTSRGAGTWTSTTSSPSQRALEEALNDIGVEYPKRASALVSGDSGKFSVAYVGTGGIDGYVKLCLHADGANASTTFADSSAAARTVTANGNAQLSTAQKKFGTASAYFDGNGDYLSIPYSSDFDYGSGDFTVDFWFRAASLPTGNHYLFGGHAAGVGYSSLLVVQSGASLQMYSASNAGNAWDVANAVVLSSALVVDTWYHVAVARSGNSLRYFLDGSLVGTITTSSTLYNNTEALLIGASSAGEYFNGYIDELRVSKGVARWTSSFTPPTAAYEYGNKYTLSTKKESELISTGSGEINALAEKTTPADADLVLIEDSAASNAKKKVTVSNLRGSSSGGGLSAAQGKTADYSVVSGDANKLTYLSKSNSADRVFSLPAAADVSNKSFTFSNLSAYALRLRVAGQSDICTGGTPAASTGTAANAFDGSTSTSCDFTATTGTLQYDFGSGVTKTVNRLRMYCDGNNGSIATFQIQASTDNTNWVTMFSQAEALTWAAAGWYDMYFKNDTAYRYWRVNILTTKGSANAKIFEVEMFDQCIQDGLSEKVLCRGESVNVFCDGSNFIIY